MDRHDEKEKGKEQRRGRNRGRKAGRSEREPRREHAANPAAPETGGDGSDGAPSPHRSPERSPEPLPVVGVAASPRDLDTLHAFLRALPAESGAAVVVVLSDVDGTPDEAAEPRRVLEALAAGAALPVLGVEDATELRPDHAYVVVPGQVVLLQDQALFLQGAGSGPGDGTPTPLPADRFFRSLAAVEHERAVCVLLSGIGTDGALGLREVKAAGGLAMVQDAAAAPFGARPRSGLATGLVDLSQPVAELPGTLARYLRQPYVRGQPAPSTDSGEADRFDEVLELLRRRVGHDFGSYKRSTVHRRIQRRMSLHRIDCAAKYVELLRRDDREGTLLCHDLLVGVTRFFRDPEAWHAVQEFAARLVAQRHDEREPIRAWCPGCSTGEETYSLAMLLLEQLDTQGAVSRLQIFGTDVVASAVHTARKGRYPANVVEDLTPERVRSFFRREGDELVVGDRLRDATIFATQDLLGDPPFSNVDLVVCRNVLIYLESAAQRQVVRLFHFALRPGGALLLGPAEAVARGDLLFEPLSSTYRLYRRLPAHTPQAGRPVLEPRHAAGAASDRDLSVESPESAASLAQRLMLEEFAPACALVDRDGELVYLHGPLSEYLHYPSGEASRDLTALALDGLRGKVRAALHRAAETGARAELEAPRVRRADRTVRVRVTVRPAPDPGRELYLVGFQDLLPAAEPAKRKGKRTKGDGSRVERLEQELGDAREDLQSTIEELETANEALQASHGALSAKNVELQAANQDLSGSKEELQSLNEELVTVNGQMEEKVGQLEEANDDLSNLLISTAIATLFLDRQLRIRRFTPVAHDLLHVLDSDLGRPIADLSLRVKDPDLLQDAHQVLEELRPVQREVVDESGRTFLRRVLPYRTADQRASGVVVTFTEITQLRRATERAEVRERQQALVAELGRRALSDDDPQQLFERAARNLAHGLGTELAKVLELEPGRDRLLLRAGVGWQQGLAGSAHVPADLDSQAGYTLRSNRPVVVTNLEQERRFSGPELLLSHGVTSGISAVIGSPDTPWGVLGVHARQERRFSADDVHFVEAMANVLADAIARHRVEEELRRRVRETSLLFQVSISVATSLEEALQACLDAVCDIAGYSVGHAFVPSPDGGELVSSGIWSVGDEARAAALRRETEGARIRPGEGFVGSIWQRREPVIVRNIHRDVSFTRRTPDAAAAVRGAVGFPVIVDGEVAAILEFFSYEEHQPDQQPLEVLRNLGEQVGRVYERNRAAERLRHSAERLALVLEAGGLGAWEWHETDDDSTWSDRLFLMLGYQPDEVAPTEEAFFHRVHPADREELRAATHRSLEAGESLRHEFRVVHPDGTVRWLETRGDLEGAGRTRRRYGVVLDVTEQRELDARLRAADRRKDVFLSTLGHELRNPLGAVANAVQLLVRGDIEAAEVPELAAMMNRQVRLMTSLLNDLLDVGRITRGSIDLERRPVRLATLVDGAVEILAGEARARGHEVSVSVKPPDLEIVADPTRLEQVLLNLLSNAIRYTVEPGAIRVDACRKGAEVRIAVADTGIGLAPEEVAYVLEPFYQTTKGSGGLGIGLSIVQELVQLHGGAVEPRSAGRGRGSEFVVRLPVREEGCPAPAGTAPAEAEDLPARLRVLVVDDHEESLGALRRLLAPHCEVATATTGASALATARDFRPEVVLLDLALPDMSGFEVAAELDRIPDLAHSRRIAMTGFGDAQTEAEVAGGHFDGQLLKPLDFRKLLDVLRASSDPPLPEEGSAPPDAP